MTEHGTFSWNELMTGDTARCQAFYTDVLGWTTREMDMGEAGIYTIFRVGDRDVGGMMKMDGPQWDGIPPHWFSYITVDDVDARVAKVEAANGKVIRPPFDVEGVGRIAIISDPSGAAIGLYKPTSQ